MGAGHLDVVTGRAELAPAPLPPQGGQGSHRRLAAPGETRGVHRPGHTYVTTLLDAEVMGRRVPRPEHSRSRRQRYPGPCARASIVRPWTPRLNPASSSSALIPTACRGRGIPNQWSRRSRRDWSSSPNTAWAWRPAWSALTEVTT